MYFLVNGKKQYKKYSDSAENIEPEKQTTLIRKDTTNLVTERYDNSSGQYNNSSGSFSITNFLVGILAGVILGLLGMWIYNIYLK